MGGRGGGEAIAEQCVSSLGDASLRRRAPCCLRRVARRASRQSRSEVTTVAQRGRAGHEFFAFQMDKFFFSKTVGQWGAVCDELRREHEKLKRRAVVSSADGALDWAAWYEARADEAMSLEQNISREIHGWWREDGMWHDCEGDEALPDDHEVDPAQFRSVRFTSSVHDGMIGGLPLGSGVESAEAEEAEAEAEASDDEDESEGEGESADVDESDESESESADEDEDEGEGEDGSEDEDEDEY